MKTSYKVAKQNIKSKKVNTRRQAKDMINKELKVKYLNIQ